MNAGLANRNSLLLLNSASARFPTGLANSSGLVGKSLMFLAYVYLYGYVDEPTDSNRAPPTCLWSKEFYETDPSRGFARGYTFQFGRGVGPVAGGRRPSRRVPPAEWSSARSVGDLRGPAGRAQPRHARPGAEGQPRHP